MPLIPVQILSLVHTAPAIALTLLPTLTTTQQAGSMDPSSSSSHTMKRRRRLASPSSSCSSSASSLLLLLVLLSSSSSPAPTHAFLLPASAPSMHQCRSSSSSLHKGALRMSDEAYYGEGGGGDNKRGPNAQVRVSNMCVVKCLAFSLSLYAIA